MDVLDDMWIVAKIEEWLLSGERPDLDLPPDDDSEPCFWYNE